MNSRRKPARTHRPPARIKKHRLKKNHLKALSFISELSKPENECEVVWIEGKHDEGISYVLSTLIGATVYNEYAWEYAGKKCLAVHGDQLDEFYRERTNLVEWSTWAYQGLQSLGPSLSALSLFEYNGKHYARAINIVAEGAARYADRNDADVISCGHTHHAEHRRVGDVDYGNSRTMQSETGSCITLGEQGVRIHLFENDNDAAKLIDVVT